MDDDLIERLALKHIAPNAGKFKAAFGLDVPYQQTEQFKRVKALVEELVDTLLASCPDGECGMCAVMICPFGDSFHFHHDGCPSCAEAEGM